MSTCLENNALLFKECLSSNDVLLVPKTGVLESRQEAQVISNYIFNSPMDTVSSEALSEVIFGVGANYLPCRFDSLPEQQDFFQGRNTRDKDFRSRAWHKWATVGSKQKDYENIIRWHNEMPPELQRYPVNICVDVAHGDTIYLHRMYEKYRALPFVHQIMSGTVATLASAEKCIESGCSHIRVGIGPGSTCTTRIVTGCGFPNLAAVFNIHFGLLNKGENIRSHPTIVADGGIKNSGDIMKYLSAGADAVMIGSLFSKTTESGGWKKPLFGRKYKYYRGQASKEFQLDKRGTFSTPEGIQDSKKMYPEYSCSELINTLNGGIASGLSYLGLKSIQDLSPSQVEFIKITTSGRNESLPHILK